MKLLLRKSPFCHLIERYNTKQYLIRQKLYNSTSYSTKIVEKDFLIEKYDYLCRKVKV